MISARLWVRQWARRVLVGAAIASALVSAQGSKKKPVKPDAFLTGGPLTLQEVLEAAQNVFPARLTKAVDARGVNFYPTPSQEQDLKKAGLGDDTIALIKKKGDSFKPPPPPPLPSTAGPITLTCAPAECNIEINGKPDGQTKGGVERVESVPLGPASSVTIDFKKEGYIGQQLQIPLKAGAVANRTVTLIPAEATLERFGTQVLVAVLQKLGGKDGLHDAQTLREEGRGTLYLSGGQQRDWNVVALLRASENLACIEINGAGLKWWTSLRGGESKAYDRGKLKGAPEAIEMEKIVTKYRDYQLATLLTRFVAEKMKLTSDSPGTEGASGVTFKASTFSGSYTVTVGANGFPEKVVYEPVSGLGSVQVIYGGYTAVSQAKVPQKMNIVFAEQNRHGMDLTFDTISAAPNLTDKDFHR